MLNSNFIYKKTQQTQVRNTTNRKDFAFGDFNVVFRAS